MAAIRSSGVRSAPHDRITSLRASRWPAARQLTVCAPALNVSLGAALLGKMLTLLR